MLTYRIDPATRAVTITAHGRITATEAQDLQKRLGADPGFDPRFTLLADCREADFTAMDAGDMRRITETIPFHVDARRAFVVAEDLSYGLARMYQAFNELAEPQRPFGVFRSVTAATRWLALPASVGAPAR